MKLKLITLLVLLSAGCAQLRVKDYFWSYKTNSDKSLTIDVDGSRNISYEKKDEITQYQKGAAEFANKAALTVCPSGFITNRGMPVDYQSKDCTKEYNLDVIAINEGRMPLPNYCTFSVYQLNVTCTKSGAKKQNIEVNRNFPPPNSLSQAAFTTGEECSKIPLQKNPIPEADISLASNNVNKVDFLDVNPDEVRVILRENTPRLRCCYQNELDSSTQPENINGRVIFKLSIGRFGEVVKSQADSGNVLIENASECFKYVLNEIRFPKARDGKSYEVSQPIHFYPKKN